MVRPNIEKLTNCPKRTKSDPKKFAVNLRLKGARGSYFRSSTATHSTNVSLRDGENSKHPPNLVSQMN